MKVLLASLEALAAAWILKCNLPVCGRCIRLDDVSNAITSSIKEISATPQQARLKVHAPLTAAMTAVGLEFMIRVN